MAVITKRTTTMHLNQDIEVVYTSDVYDGVKLDTRVEISGKTLCWIVGLNISEFHKALSAIVARYKI